LIENSDSALNADVDAKDHFVLLWWRQTGAARETENYATPAGSKAR
jgi:hypothetical protein